MHLEPRPQPWGTADPPCRIGGRYTDGFLLGRGAHPPGSDPPGNKPHFIGTDRSAGTSSKEPAVAKVTTGGRGGGRGWGPDPGTKHLRPCEPHNLPETQGKKPEHARGRKTPTDDFPFMGQSREHSLRPGDTPHSVLHRPSNSTTGRFLGSS